MARAVFTTFPVDGDVSPKVEIVQYSEKRFSTDNKPSQQSNKRNLQEALRGNVRDYTVGKEKWSVF